MIEESQVRQAKIFQILKEEKRKLKISSDLLEPDESELKLNGTYGKLPELRVDQNHGAIFPVPISKPSRFSWYQISLSCRWTIKKLVRLEKEVEAWRHSSHEKRISQFDALASQWIDITAKLLTVLQQARYLEAWVPSLKAVKSPVNEQVVQALFKGEPDELDEIRDFFRPKRVQHPSYLPESLEDASAGVIFLPIATDISNAHFRAETEGALDTYWNQSVWAKKNKVSFHIRWTSLPKNLAFAQGKENLMQHLARFPRDRAGMTTGGLTTQVKRQILILGPGRMQPRTLAHELGHLLGFNDCYFRTLTGQGLFGLGVLEWDNPFYPDDLMCDNLVGAVHAEIW
jgi:hypothetical protein